MLDFFLVYEVLNLYKFSSSENENLKKDKH